MLICEAVEPDGKSCRACGQYKSLDEYYPMVKGKYGRAVYCKSCCSARPRETPSHHAENRRASELRVRYALTSADWERMFEQQGGLCDLCAAPLRRGRGKGSAATDHIHGTKVVRALLCFCCNTGIGKFHDDPELMRKAASYVEYHRAKIT